MLFQRRIYLFDFPVENMLKKLQYHNQTLSKSLRHVLNIRGGLSAMSMN